MERDEQQQERQERQGRVRGVVENRQAVSNTVANAEIIERSAAVERQNATLERIEGNTREFKGFVRAISEAVSAVIRQEPQRVPVRARAVASEVPQSSTATTATIIEREEVRESQGSQRVVAQSVGAVRRGRGPDRQQRRRRGVRAQRVTTGEPQRVPVRARAVASEVPQSSTATTATIIEREEVRESQGSQRVVARFSDSLNSFSSRMQGAGGSVADAAGSGFGGPLWEAMKEVSGVMATVAGLASTLGGAIRGRAVANGRGDSGRHEDHQLHVQRTPAEVVAIRELSEQEQTQTAEIVKAIEDKKLSVNVQCGDNDSPLDFPGEGRGRGGGGRGRGRGGRGGGRGGGRLSRLSRLGGRALGAAGRIAGRVAAPLTALMAGYSRYQEVQDDEKLSSAQKTVKVSATAGGAMAGAGAGAALGASVGSVVPVVGTLIGGLIGGALGGWLGSEGGDIVGDAVSEQMAGEDATATTAEAIATRKQEQTSNIMPTVPAQAVPAKKAELKAVPATNVVHSRTQAGHAIIRRAEAVEKRGKQAKISQSIKKNGPDVGVGVGANRANNEVRAVIDEARLAKAIGRVMAEENRKNQEMRGNQEKEIPARLEDTLVNAWLNNAS